MSVHDTDDLLGLLVERMAQAPTDGSVRMWPRHAPLSDIELLERIRASRQHWMRVGYTGPVAGILALARWELTPRLRWACEELAQELTSLRLGDLV